jgi:glycosyltransferase involved in cell wall biosynthesis
VRPVVCSRVPELLRACRHRHISTFRNLWFKNETRRRWLLPYYLLAPILIAQYAYLIMRYHIDVLVLGSRDDQIFGSLAARLCRRPVIWIDHADMKGVAAHRLRFLGRSYYSAMRYTNRIVAVSASERQKIFAHVSEDVQSKFVVINNGAVRRNAQPLARPKNSFIITFVGRIEADKGIFDLTEAAISICKHHSQAIFWLVGKGVAEDEVQQRINASDLNERIKLLGHLSNVYEALDASDLFVYPSHHDASPLAPAEALLAGLPVIATNIGGIPEVIDDSCGILVEPGSPRHLASAIEKVMTNPAVLRSLQVGARRKSKAVDFDAIVGDRYLPLLMEAIND